MASLLYGSLAYLGEYAGAGAVGDALALAFLQARKWDSLGTGLGTAQEGHWYVNLTDHQPRHWLNGAWAAFDVAGAPRPPLAHTQTVSTISDSGSKGRQLVQCSTGKDARNSIGAQQTYNRNSDPGINNDGVDTAGIGIAFTIGDAWVRNDTSPRRWYRADSVATGAAVWTQFNPAVFATAAQGARAPTEPANPADDGKVWTAGGGNGSWVSPTGGGGDIVLTTDGATISAIATVIGGGIIDATGSPNRTLVAFGSCAGAAGEGEMVLYDLTAASTITTRALANGAWSISQAVVLAEASHQYEIRIRRTAGDPTDEIYVTWAAIQS